MRLARMVVPVLLLVLVLAACAPQAAPAPQASAPATATPAAKAAVPKAVPSAPTKAAWEKEWERVLAEAKNEGRVMLTSTLSAAGIRAMVEDMKDTYRIDIEATSGRSAEFHTKILAERRAGLYLRDVAVEGWASPYTDLEPTGVLASLDPALIIPDVTDPQLIKKTWYRGDLWWVDRDHLGLAFLMGPYPPLAVNTNLVKPGEIKSYNDLLDPKWKGKMAINDPTISGSSFATFMIPRFGQDWLRKLAAQEPTIMRDQRLLVDWLAHAKIPVALAVQDRMYAEFKSAGAPIQVVVPAEGTWLSAGGGCIWLYTRAPHPNASKVFINRLLTKEMQTTLSRLSGTQSAREDVPTDFLESWQIRQADAKYYEVVHKEVPLPKTEELKITKEIFGYLIK